MLGVAVACRVQAPAGPPLSHAVTLPAFDPAAIAEGRPPELGPLPPLRVRDYGPEGLHHGERIRVRFNQAVADLGAEPPPVELELWALPAADGETAAAAPRRVPARSRWARPDVLELEPEAPLGSATAYEVVLPAGLRNRDGSTLEALRWRFETPRPMLELLWPDDPVGRREPFYVVADQPVRAEVLSEHLRVHASRAPGGEARALPLRVRAVDWTAWPHAERYADWRYGAAALATGWLFAVEPERAWPRGATGTLRVEPGLRGESGPLPLLEAMEAEIATRDALRVLDWSCQGQTRSCEDGPIVLRLTHELPNEELARIRVRPRPPGLEIRSSHDYEADRPTLEIHGDFAPGRRYVVELPASLTDAYGQRLGRRVRVDMRVRATPEPAHEQPGPAALELWSTRGTFLRLEDARVGLVAAHVGRVRVRAAVLDDATRVALLHAEDLGAVPWPAAGATEELLTLETHGPEADSEHVLDLARFAALGDAVLVEVEAEELTAGAQLSQPLEPARGLFQISGLGAVVEMGPARGVARVTRAADGEPWPGVAPRLQTRAGERALPVTDVDGLVRLPGARSMAGETSLWLDAPTGDRLVVPLADMRWPSARVRFGHQRSRGHDEGDPSAPPAGLRRGEQALVAMETGRSLFLPGETIHVAGWAGIATPYGDQATRRATAGTPVLLELRHRGEEVVRRRVRLGQHGRFWASLRLPEAAPLGDYELLAHVLESGSRVRLTLADVRLPTFEVRASMLHGHRVLGEPNRLRLDARNLSGDPTPMEQLRWSMACHQSRTDLEPFGWSFHAAIDVPPLEREGELAVAPADAHAELELPTHELAPGVPHQCIVHAAAQDVSLQEAGAETSFFVHPAPVYVGLLVPNAPVVGEPLAVEVQALDLKRRRVALADVEVRIHRLSKRIDPWRVSDEPPAERRLVARCRLAPSQDGDHPRCTLRRPKAGYYEVQATAVHEGIALRSDARFEIAPARREQSRGSGDEPAIDPADGSSREPAAERPRALAIKAPWELAAGRRATIVIEAPWPDGKGLLSIAQTGLRAAQPFELRDGRAELAITPRAGQGAHLELRATMARPAADGMLPRVHVAERGIHVREPRELLVRIDAPAAARPGERVSVRLVVRDPEREQPVDARLAVWVIDDAVHQLQSPSRRDLASVFNPARPGLVTLTDAYQALLAPFSPWRMRGRSRASTVRQAKASVKGSFVGEVQARFDPEPLFVGDLGTGPDGEAELELTLPHDLTRFRITAIASAELPGGGSGPARFGEDEASVQVTAPLMVRLALPRVLRPGDEAELAALVTPPRGAKGTLEVELSLEDAEDRLTLRGPARAVRAVDGRGPIRVPFSVRAEGPGQPEVRVHARLRASSANAQNAQNAHSSSSRSSGRVLDTTVQRPLAVELERTAIERASIHGRLDRDEPIAIPLRVPEGARPDHGGLTLSVRGTAIGDLDEAALYLEEYPYGCVEQTASRLLPQVALRGLADRLPAGVDPTVRVAEGIARLLSMQNEDGTFRYWPDDLEVAPHAGTYATWVMQLAADAGEPVPAKALARALDAILARLSTPLPGPSEARDLRLAELTLEAHVLVRGGRGADAIVQATLDDLYARRETLPLFARAWLLMALHGADPHDPRVADVRRDVSTSIETLPGSAQPVATASDRYAELFDSDARTHALVLMAFLQLDPTDPLVDDLAHGLRLRRSGGRWRNTQENAYALLALSTFAREREPVVPDHRIDAWIGPRRLDPLEQRGRDPAPRERSVTMAELLGPLGTERTTTVVLDREGEGAAYWSLGMEWAPTGPAPARTQGGLSLVRRLLDADGEPVDSGSLRAGRRYLLEVTLESDVPQSYLAIEAPLPAGLEAIDASLGAGSRARASLEPTVEDDWVDHRELHRDRVLLFADELGSGRHVLAVPVLATTPGRYVLPAATAEAMYSPEIRARTTATRVHVSPRD